MGEPVFVCGKSGNGKTYSLRNLPADKVGIFSINGKRPPFRSKLPTANRPTYRQIIESLRANNKRLYVIDDSTYLMLHENFDRAGEKGYDKFVQMAKNFYDLIQAAKATDDETIVYFMHHPEQDGLGGEKLKTVGKMLDEKLCLEGEVTVFIDCKVDPDGNHFFTARENPMSLAKCPPGMLPERMDNDLYEVDKLIRDYWGMEPLNDTEQESENA